MYNENAKGCAIVQDVKENSKAALKNFREKENVNLNIMEAEEIPIQTIKAPDDHLKIFEKAMKKAKLSGVKRSALEMEELNKTKDNELKQHKRKYFGEESENRLAQLFREKIKSRRNKQAAKMQPKEESEESESQSGNNSDFKTPVIEKKDESSSSEKEELIETKDQDFKESDILNSWDLK